jgi:hypothetical protein
MAGTTNQGILALPFIIKKLYNNTPVKKAEFHKNQPGETW